MTLCPAILIQARMSSARLPGKVLAPVAGRPLLDYLLERMERVAGAPPVIVLTSTDSSDDPIVEFCARRKTRCERGPLDDVAGRFMKTIESFGLTSFARVCGDSPLLDPKLVERLWTLFDASHCDVATNILRRTFPKGQSVEIVSADAFRRAYAAMDNMHDKEHVTTFFYAHMRDFRVADLVNEPAMGKLQLAVDTADDLAAFEAAVAAMTAPAAEYGLEHIIRLPPYARQISKWHVGSTLR